MNLAEMRTRSRTHRPISGAVILWIFAICLFATPAYTGTDVSLPTTGEDIGATNPVGAADTNMFRDDELNVWAAVRDTAAARFFPGAPTKDDLTTWDFNFSAPPIRGISGPGLDYGTDLSPCEALVSGRQSGIQTPTQLGPIGAWAGLQRPRPASCVGARRRDGDGWFGTRQIAALDL